jgi:DNA-directed RNA polymerase specialized sigma24 family protein
MPALHADREELVTLNDPQLAQLIRAEDAEAEREIEHIIAAARPVIEGVVARCTRAPSRVTREDAEDIRATIQLRLVVKLRAIARDPREAVQNLRGYVATVAYNTVHDHLRKRFPERANLKTRVRYALTHDSRFALWTSSAGPVCGLAAWEGREEWLDTLPSDAVQGIARDDTAAALEQLMVTAQQPVLLDEAVDAIAAAWNITDHDPAPLDELRDAISIDATDDLDFARSLWAEVRELRPMQRGALLLNLRYGGETNVISLLILSRTATFDEIAAALELSRVELASLWRRLPLDDLAIAERFGITRQQVINLRKSARERLVRKLRR